MSKRLIAIFALALFALPVSSAWADSCSDTANLFRNAGQSADFFKTAYGYAVFPTIGKGGVGVLLVDGKEVARQQMEHTIPFTLQWDETFDIGSDTGTPVNDQDYHVPFVFTGKINKVTLNLKPTGLSAEDQKLLDEKSQRNNQASE